MTILLVCIAHELLNSLASWSTMLLSGLTMGRFIQYEVRLIEELFYSSFLLNSLSSFFIEVNEVVLQLLPTFISFPFLFFFFFFFLLFSP